MTLRNLPANRLQFVDGMRAVLSTYVVFYHAILMGWATFIGVRPPGWLAPFCWGPSAVSGFIVLSGFCLTLPVAGDGQIKGGPNGFIRRRAKRILPTFYAALIFSLAIRFVLADSAQGRQIPYLPVLSCILMMHNIFVPLSINGAFWSIAVEWQIYLCFPLLIALRSAIGSVRSTVLILILSHVLWWLLRPTMLNGLMLNYYGLFAIGMLAAQCAQVEKSKMPLAWLAVGSLLTLSVGACFCRQYAVLPIPLLVDLPLAILVACVLICGYQNSPIAHTLSSFKLPHLGLWTYSIYLTHMPMQMLVRKMLIEHLHTTPLQTFLGVLAATPIILLCSYGFFKLFEEPVTGLKPSLLVRTENYPPSPATV